MSYWGKKKKKDGGSDERPPKKTINFEKREAEGCGSYYKKQPYFFSKKESRDISEKSGAEFANETART